MLFTLLFACTNNAQVWFSPDASLTDQLVGEMNAAANTLDVAIYTFTSEPIRDAMIDAGTRGVTVRAVIDSSEFGAVNDSIARDLDAANVQVRRLGGFSNTTSDPKMHHKFAVVDDQAVISGSFNYTYSADEANHENLMLIRDPALAGQFTSAFNELWDAGQPE
ncbi:MAG: phospholipase D-like domain-containing protein [Myxococcota bacterium]